MPAAEVDIDATLVRALLRDQHPDLAELDLTLLASGWDNTIFRLGDTLTVRLPHRSLAAPLIEHEQRWLPELAARLPLPIPAPVRQGRPAHGYPWSWSVTPWFPGVPACDASLSDLALAARTLGQFIAALHRPAPADAPENPWRGTPLTERGSRVHEQLTQLEGTVDTDALRSLWVELVETPPWSGEPLWMHGDLHPANVLVHDGKVSAVIDFGDLTSGDPATDVSVAWMLLPPQLRGEFRAAAGDIDDNTWARARAWALSLGLVYVAVSAEHPRMVRIGRDVLDAVLADG